MCEAQPIGIPILYTRENDLFSWNICTGKTNWSMESLNYLNFLSSTKFSGQKIQSILVGEKIVETKNGKFTVDGYINYKGEEYFIEFMGCFFHTCILNCGVKSREDTRDRDQKKYEDLIEKGTVLRIFGCEWEKLKKTVNSVTTSPFSSFFYQNHISQDDILLAIAENKFYGFVKCDIECPPNVMKYWSFFPPVFKRVSPSFENLSDSMKKFFLNKKISPQLSVGFNSQQILLGTETIRFYLEQGFHIHNVTLALEFQKG